MELATIIYQAKDVAALLGLSPARVSQLMSAGKITPTGKIGLDERPAFTTADLHQIARDFHREQFVADVIGMEDPHAIG